MNDIIEATGIIKDFLTRSPRKLITGEYLVSPEEFTRLKELAKDEHIENLQEIANILGISLFDHMFETIILKVKYY